MDGGKTSRVPGVEKLQEIESLASADFPKYQPVGTVAQGGPQEIPDGNRRETVLCGCRASKRTRLSCAM